MAKTIIIKENKPASGETEEERRDAVSTGNCVSPPAPPPRRSGMTPAGRGGGGGSGPHSKKSCLAGMMEKICFKNLNETGTSLNRRWGCSSEWLNYVALDGKFVKCLVIRGGDQLPFEVGAATARNAAIAKPYTSDCLVVKT
ncbi:hypothetical protein GWI33_013317 [Rhynchophorus ferrugineus]|uniref:Uncharacterized protein n=1 Tax=Rhynchophorus ferrugineus TaxID=354439 RepID=A0A834I7A2_RHYFE|nr:hypothetical protein GWI33_013317 [Rhynchophorus ferrugineus]